MAINVFGQAGPAVNAQQVYGAPDFQQPFMQSQVPQYGIQSLIEGQAAGPQTGLDWQRVMSMLYGAMKTTPYDYGGAPSSPGGGGSYGGAPKAQVYTRMPAPVAKSLPSLSSLMGSV